MPAAEIILAAIQVGGGAHPIFSFFAKRTTSARYKKGGSLISASMAELTEFANIMEHDDVDKLMDMYEELREKKRSVESKRKFPKSILPSTMAEARDFLMLTKQFFERTRDYSDQAKGRKIRSENHTPPVPNERFHELLECLAALLEPSSSCEESSMKPASDKTTQSTHPNRNPECAVAPEGEGYLLKFVTDSSDGHEASSGSVQSDAFHSTPQQVRVLAKKVSSGTMKSFVSGATGWTEAHAEYEES